MMTPKGSASRLAIGVLLAALALTGCSGQATKTEGEAAKGSTRVPPETTQPPADRLLNHAGLLAAIERLRTSDRLSVETIGTTVEGRPIPMLIITAPGRAPADLRREARRLSGPDVTPRSIVQSAIVEPPFADLLPKTRLPVLLAGASWGHEAAQVEGLMAAAEVLASDRSPEIQRAMERTVVLIVPCMNPDGRERAITEWRRTPLSTGNDGVGNAHGFMLNRDFIHQTQPEAWAILDVTRAWRPVVGVDLHEDMFHLGVAFPEVAFVPPFDPGFDVEEDPGTRQAIIRTGAAIDDRWRRAGHSNLYDPTGDKKFAPLPPIGSGKVNPVAGSSGRLEFMWTIHGIAGLITESARSPGAQTWEARVDQKRLAALAAVDVVARNSEVYAKAVYTRRLVDTQAGRASGEFVAVPHDQAQGADLPEFRRLLRAHDVLVFEAKGAPYDVIPLGQPEGAFVRHAVLAERSKLNDLPAALGVRVLRSAELSAQERQRLAGAPLVPITTVAEPWPPNRGPADLRGRPVGIYRGQGMDRVSWGELEFVLKWLGFTPVLLSEDDVRAGRWGGASAVVFGDGSTREIVGGWDHSAVTRRSPWQPEGPSRGIGPEGAAQLATFVRGGGRLITVGRSAGLVRQGRAPLLDVTSVDGPSGTPGIGQVTLHVTPAGKALFKGVPTGNSTVRAFLHAPPGGTEGGYLFRAADAAMIAATYAGAVTFEAERSFAAAAQVAASSQHAAVVVGRVGGGYVVLFGIAPSFRGQWRSTFPLLVNAVVGPLDTAEQAQKD